jgi:hypothetical protein
MSCKTLYYQAATPPPRKCYFVHILLSDNLLLMHTCGLIQNLLGLCLPFRDFRISFLGLFFLSAWMNPGLFVNHSWIFFNESPSILYNYFKF